MEDVKHSIASLQAIRAMGVTIAIDDFGTGFSSLSYLSKLPVDTLKIDRSFVVDMTGRPEGLALVSTIINLAHSLKLKVVAEGVETEEQSRLLRLLNCDEMQGYLFSKPVPRAIFETRFLRYHLPRINVTLGLISRFGFDRGAPGVSQRLGYAGALPPSCEFSPRMQKSRPEGGFCAPAGGLTSTWLLGAHHAVSLRQGIGVVAVGHELAAHGVVVVLLARTDC